MSQERVEIVISIPEDSAPLSIRIMRGNRLVHLFEEPEALPPTPTEPGDAE